MRRKRGSHGRQRRGPQLGIFPKNLAESSDPRTNRQHRIEVAASDRLVMGGDLDLSEARSFQNAAHAVGVGERERAGRVRIVGGLRRQMSGRGPKRQDVERVLLQRSPADEGESPLRPEAATNVDECRRGVGEEHHPEPREGGVERGRFEGEHLGICLDEPHALAPFGRALRERQHRSRQIHPHDCAVRRDRPRKGQRGFTPATADIQDTLARARRKRGQGAPTKRSELSFQCLPDLRPRADPYVVLGQRGRGAGLVHAGIIARRLGNVEVAWHQPRADPRLPALWAYAVV